MFKIFFIQTLNRNFVNMVIFYPWFLKYYPWFFCSYLYLNFIDSFKSEADNVDDETNNLDIPGCESTYIFIIRYVIIVTEDISDPDTFDINMKHGKPSQMLTTAGNPSSSEQSKKRKSI